MLFSSPFSSSKRLPRFASTLLWHSFCPTLIKLSSSLKTKFGSWLVLNLSSIPHPPPPLTEDQLPTPTSYGYNESTLSRTPHVGNERTTAEHRNVILLHSLMCYKPESVCLCDCYTGTSMMPIKEKGYFWREIIHEGKIFGFWTSHLGNLQRCIKTELRTILED